MNKAQRWLDEWNAVPHPASVPEMGPCHKWRRGGVAIFPRGQKVTLAFGGGGLDQDEIPGLLAFMKEYFE